MKPTTSVRKDSYMETTSSMYDYFCCNPSLFEKKIEEIMLYIDTNRRLGYNSNTIPKTTEIVSFPIMTRTSYFLNLFRKLYQENLGTDMVRRLRLYFKSSDYYNIPITLFNSSKRLEEPFLSLYHKHFSKNVFTTALFVFFSEIIQSDALHFHSSTPLSEMISDVRRYSIQLHRGSIYTKQTGRFKYEVETKGYNNTGNALVTPFEYDAESDCIFLKIELYGLYYGLARSNKNTYHSLVYQKGNENNFPLVYNSDKEDKSVIKLIKKSNITDEKMNVMRSYLKKLLIGSLRSVYKEED